MGEKQHFVNHAPEHVFTHAYIDRGSVDIENYEYDGTLLFVFPFYFASVLWTKRSPLNQQIKSEHVSISCHAVNIVYTLLVGITGRSPGMYLVSFSSCQQDDIGNSVRHIT